MSSVCGGLDYKDAESHISASSPNKCSNNGSNHVSVTGSEDAQESDGDDSGNIHQYLNEESKDITTEPLLPLKSSDDEVEDKNLAKDMLSESPQVSAAIVIPAIKGSREKHGKSVEKLSVSWAEDVYDPPPSIVSHTRSKKQQQHQKSKSSLKKSGKKGHKGSSSSSSSSSSRGSKDKKSSSSSRSKHSRDKFGWATQMPIAAASS
ncbi:zinc finger Ran-binding domain-containing protein 2 isoform X1 [Brassica napus]|nr:zinc finger Ran-binding domain-containing protein 2 isoform X1 [Brassica napus]